MARSEQSVEQRREYARALYATEEGRALHRSRVARSRYGLDLHVLRELYEMQEGCCAICGEWGEQPYTQDQRGMGGKGSLRIDHDHESGEVRGLLCTTCNSALGKFRDSPRLLVRAAAYLMERGGQ